MHVHVTHFIVPEKHTFYGLDQQQMIGANQQTGLVFVFIFLLLQQRHWAKMLDPCASSICPFYIKRPPYCETMLTHPVTSSGLSTFMKLATHPMKNKWEPTYLHPLNTPQYTHRHRVRERHTQARPQTPYASGRIAHSFVLDPSQQEAAFSPATQGARLDLLQLLLKNLSYKCGHKSIVWVTFVLHPSFFSFPTYVEAPDAYRCI